MVNLRNYMNDGANWQAQCVLAILRAGFVMDYILSPTLRKDYTFYENKYDASLEVGRYENCREQGYIFSIRYFGKQKNYAVYEHRNSDALCVLISEVSTLNTPSIDNMWHDKGENASKYDFDKEFREGEVTECAKWIQDDMRKTLRRWTIERDKYDLYRHSEED